MKETKKLSTSSWLTLAAAVLGIIGLVAYSTSDCIYRAGGFQRRVPYYCKPQ